MQLEISCQSNWKSLNNQRPYQLNLGKHVKTFSSKAVNIFSVLQRVANVLDEQKNHFADSILGTFVIANFTY